MKQRATCIKKKQGNNAAARIPNDES
jgi:hypothetical protein